MHPSIYIVIEKNPVSKDKSLPSPRRKKKFLKTQTNKKTLDFSHEKLEARIWWTFKRKDYNIRILYQAKISFTSVNASKNAKDKQLYVPFHT